MKALKLACIATLLILVQTLLGQETEHKFLLQNNKSQLTTFYASIAPMTSFSSLNNQSVNVMDISAGLIVNKKFYLAFFMSGTNKINKIEVPVYGSEEYIDWIEAGVELYNLPSDAEFVYANFKHSGLKFGYMHNTQNMVFWRAGAIVGFIGGFQLSEAQTFLNMFDNVVFKESIFTAEPNVGIGFNLLPWWRIHLDAGYRLMNVDPKIIKSANVDSFTFKLSFAFGKFAN